MWPKIGRVHRDKNADGCEMRLNKARERAAAEDEDNRGRKQTYKEIIIVLTYFGFSTFR